MHRDALRPLPRLFGVAWVAILLAVCAALAHAGPAAANPELDQKKAQLEKVRHQVQALDNRVELLTEQYDGAVVRLHQLRVQIRRATRRLQAAEIHLAYEQSVLANLMVARYKGLDSTTLDIVLGASSLDQVTGSLDIQQRFDAAVTEAVDQIQIARDAIRAQRVQLIATRVQVLAQKRLIAKRRDKITAMLRHRRRLEHSLGSQVRIGEAADSIGQAHVALEAAAWVHQDMKQNQGDPGALVRDQVVLDGLAQIGVPYVWGGASPQAGFDCSGLVMWLWARHGVALPHFAASQYHLGPFVAKSDLRIGDLVFFHELGHVGIYIGHGYVLHAPHTGTTVQIESFDIPWFQNTYVGATRPGPP
jgi:cell wall-associated NlpC family hydrolase